MLLGKLVLHGFYKPHTFKAALQNLVYSFILTIEKRLRRQDEVINMRSVILFLFLQLFLFRFVYVALVVKKIFVLFYA